MRDEIARMRVVDRALGVGLPRVIGAGIIGEHADDVDVFDILERVLGRVDQLAAKDKVQALGHEGVL